MDMNGVVSSRDGLKFSLRSRIQMATEIMNERITSLEAELKRVTSAP